MASSVGLIVLTMVGSLYGLALKTSQRVVASSEVIAQGQVAMRGIEGGVRNSAVDGVQIGDGGDRLVVHTRAAGDPEAWECRAWLFVADATQTGSSRSGVLYTKTAPVGTDLASVDDPQAATWTVAISSARGSSSVFGWGPPGLRGTGGGMPGDTVHITLAPSWVNDRSQGQEMYTVRLRSAITPQPQDQKGDGGCFA